MGYRDETFAPLLGQKVVALDKTTVFLENGLAFTFDLDGDCCSSSSYTPEGEAAFRELVGATIAAIEDRGSAGSSWQNIEPSPTLQAREAALVEKYPPSDVDSWHFLVITTDKGYVTIDWRNESNGYYDGTCFLTPAKPLHPVVQDAILEGRDPAEIRRMIGVIGQGN